MRGPVEGGGPIFPLVCGAGVGAGSTVRGAARPRRTGGGIDTTTTTNSLFGIDKIFDMRKELYRKLFTIAKIQSVLTRVLQNHEEY